MKFLRVIFVSLLWASVAQADSRSEATVLSSSLSSLDFAVHPANTPGNIKGWNHLYKLLVREGISEKDAARALADQEMPERGILLFSLDPKEKRALYRKHDTRANRANALKFYLANKDLFAAARKKYDVPEGVILSILQVETACGKNTGGTDIFPALARLANAGEPETVRENIAHNPTAKEDAVFKRAAYLESTFLPQLVAAFKIAKQYGGTVHDLHGSSGGALGIPQFLPKSILDYGVDADGDGRVEIHEAPDAIFSAANYLHKKGWKSGSAKQERAVIWEYNHSAPYIDTVLGMAAELNRAINRGVQEADLKGPVVARRANKAKGHKHRRIVRA